MNVEVKAFIPKEWAEKAKASGIRHQKFIYKCYARYFLDPDSLESSIADECSLKPTKGEEKVECVACSGEGLRKHFKYTTSGLMCRECFREKDFEKVVKKMEIDSIKNSSIWRDR